MKRLRNLLGAGLICLLMTVALAGGAKADFVDVAEGASWYWDSVYFCLDNGLFAGTSDTTFEPEAPMTRAMFVTVLSRLYGAQVDNYAQSKFQDVPVGQWYSGAVAWASEACIVSGTSDTTFEPNRPVTRQEMCIMVRMFLSYGGVWIVPNVGTAAFADDGQIAGWAVEAVYACRDAGIVSGQGDNLFNPQSSSRRCEVAMVVQNLVEAINWVHPVGADPNTGLRYVNHRGCSAQAPENTLPAFQLSAAMGFHTVETDVRFTADNVPVLCHDASIRRVATNPDGTPLAGELYVSDCTYDQLLYYDFGMATSSRYAGTKLASFAQLMQYCHDANLSVYVELKEGSKSQMRKLVNIVRFYGMEGRVTWISFSPVLLEYITWYDGSSRLGVLCNSLTDPVVSAMLALRTGSNQIFADLNIGNMNDDAINTAYNARVGLEVWTVDSPLQITATIKRNITGLTTNTLLPGALG